MKVLVTTGSFIAGAVIDDETKIVRETDHYLAHLRGLKEDQFREHCQKNGWAVASAE
jgi:hypothetical protein